MRTSRKTNLLFIFALQLRRRKRRRRRRPTTSEAYISRLLFYSARLDIPSVFFYTLRVIDCERPNRFSINETPLHLLNHLPIQHAVEKITRLRPMSVRFQHTYRSFTDTHTDKVLHQSEITIRSIYETRKEVKSTRRFFFFSKAQLSPRIRTNPPTNAFFIPLSLPVRRRRCIDIVVSSAFHWALYTPIRKLRGVIAFPPFQPFFPILNRSATRRKMAFH